jgi:DNA polymerase I-like protein with 3'-5' exonuclease and polymerase domains
MNRAAIAFCVERNKRGALSKAWADTFIVSQIHDELVVECPEEIGQEVAQILKFVMENTTKLPGVLLETNPKIGKSLTELK